MSQVFVIIVHCGSPEATHQSLHHLLAGTVLPARIMIIDHDPHPLSRTGISDRVRVLRPAQNKGYGAGVNMGLGALLTVGTQLNDTVIAMNNDVVVQPETLATIQEWRNAHPAPALAGVVAQEGNNLVYGGGRLNKWTGRAQLNTTPDQQLEYVHGAFLVAPYEVFLKTQGLPEDFFLYWEDVAFSYTLRQHHIPLEIISKARVTHHTAATDRLHENQLYYLVRNGALFWEQYPAWPWRRYWKLRNYLRRQYHRAHKRTIVHRALRDARRRQVGVKAA